MKSHNIVFFVFFIIIPLSCSFCLADANLSSAPLAGHAQSKVNFSPKAEYIAGDMVVKFKPSIIRGNPAIVDGIAKTSKESVNNIFKQLKVKSMKKIFMNTEQPFEDIYHLQYAQSKSIIDALNMLADDENVEWIEPNYISYTSLMPNDYNPSQQWGLARIKSDLSWDITQGNSNIVIAIVDTGIDYNHSDLSANIWHNSDEIPGNGLDDDNNGFIDDDIGWDFVSPTIGGVPGEDMGPRDRDPMDFHGHGTHCSGIASAVTNNGLGIAGTAWSCRIMAVRAGYAVTGGGVLQDVDSAPAIVYAADNGAHVISMSWSGSEPSNLISTAIYYAYSQGCILVAAAGNQNTSSIYYPAGYDEVIAVAASDQNDNRASFSNYGSWVDIAAPGVSIKSTLPNNKYGDWNGTSMAAPFVAGVSALMLSRDPTKTQEYVLQTLVNSGDDINWGVAPYKRLNAFKSVESVPLLRTITLNIGTGWNLISCPGDPVITSFTQLLTGTSIVPYALTWDADTGNFFATDLFEFGKGYWWAAIENTQITIQYYPRISFTMPAKTSWNIIGSVDGSVPINSITSIPPGSVLPYSLKWDAIAEKYVSSASVEPGFGYFVAAIQNATLTISYPPAPISSASVATKTPDWQGKIKLVEDGKSPVQELCFGVDTEASDGIDTMDVLMPPELDNSFVPHIAGDAIFSKSIKKRADIVTWQLKLGSVTENTKVSWDISGIPSSISLTLINGINRVDMRKDKNINLPKGEHTLILEASSMTIKDVTSLVKITNKDVSFDTVKSYLNIKMVITNIGKSPIYTPLHLVITNLAAGVTVANADGVKKDGSPYIDFSRAIGDMLKPGDESKALSVLFSNPKNVKYTFDLRCEGRVSGDILAAPMPGLVAKHYDELHVVVPVKSHLLQNYPNPFNPETWIPYELALPSEVKVNIYDVQGRLVRMLDLGYRGMGEYFTKSGAAYWDGRNEGGETVQSGIYFYQLSAGDYHSVKKMAIVK